MRTDDSAILQKTRELCQSILAQPEVQTSRNQIDAFMADHAAQSQYQKVAELGERLQHKKRMGEPMSGDEVSAFEQDRRALLENPVARGFLEAQEAMHQVQSSVNQYVAKTLELGRVPGPEDLESESCGPGCGCGH